MIITKIANKLLLKFSNNYISLTFEMQRLISNFEF